MFKSPRDIWFVDTLLSELVARLELANRIGLEVLIEEVEAVARVDEIAACCDRLEALILGVGGFMIDAATARVFQVTLDRQAQIDAKEPR